MNRTDCQNIAIIENSEIIQKGIHRILSDSNINCKIFRVSNLDDFKKLVANKVINLAIMNPVLIINNLATLKNFKSQHHKIIWLAIQYSYTDQIILNEFENVLQINDTPEILISKIREVCFKDESAGTLQTIMLSEREIEIIKLLVKGYSNKEIADSLFLSIHTVITHRKNITQKTGIKSLAGLTIFAVSKNLITLDDYKFNLPQNS